VQGVSGPLIPIRPRPTRRAAGSGDPAPDPAAGPVYRLADYLDQTGRRSRREQIPPAAFWAAAATSAYPGDLATLGGAAHDRGLYRDAAQLYKHATAHGDTFAASRLVHSLHSLHPTDPRPGSWSATYAALDDPGSVALLVGALREAGAADQVAALLARVPAAHATLNDPGAVAFLVGALREAGAADQVAVLAVRAAAHAVLDDPGGRRPAAGSAAGGGCGGPSRCVGGSCRHPCRPRRPTRRNHAARSARGAGAADQVTVLADRAATHAALDNPRDVAWLLDALAEAGAGGQVTVLLARDPAAHATLDHPGSVAMLLGALGEAGAGGQVTVLLARDPAAHATLDDRLGVANLLYALREIGAQEQAEVLIDRLPGAGRFDQFCEQEGHQERFRYGREADGSPARQWGWEDLD
jgi:hypothetical protein